MILVVIWDGETVKRKGGNKRMKETEGQGVEREGNGDRMIGI